MDSHQLANKRGNDLVRVGDWVRREYFVNIKSRKVQLEKPREWLEYEEQHGPEPSQSSRSSSTTTSNTPSSSSLSSLHREQYQSHQTPSSSTNISNVILGSNTVFSKEAAEFLQQQDNSLSPQISDLHLLNSQAPSSSHQLENNNMDHGLRDLNQQQSEDQNSEDMDISVKDTTSLQHDNHQQEHNILPPPDLSRDPDNGKMEPNAKKRKMEESNVNALEVIGTDRYEEMSRNTQNDLKLPRRVVPLIVEETVKDFDLWASSLSGFSPAATTSTNHKIVSEIDTDSNDAAGTLLEDNDGNKIKQTGDDLSSCMNDANEDASKSNFSQVDTVENTLTEIEFDPEFSLHEPSSSSPSSNVRERNEPTMSTELYGSSSSQQQLISVEVVQLSDCQDTTNGKQDEGTQVISKHSPVFLRRVEHPAIKKLLIDKLTLLGVGDVDPNHWDVSHIIAKGLSVEDLRCSNSMIKDSMQLAINPSHIIGKDKKTGKERFHCPWCPGDWADRKGFVKHLASRCDPSRRPRKYRLTEEELAAIRADRDK